MDSDLPVFQEFKSKDGKPLESLPTHIADDIVGRYVLWSDILHAFKGINVVKDWNEDRVFFVLDGYAVYVPSLATHGTFSLCFSISQGALVHT